MTSGSGRTSKLGKCWSKGSQAEDIWMEDMGLWVRWGLEPILVEKAPPLKPIGKVPMEVEDSIMLAQEYGATEKSTAAEQAT